MRDIPIIIVCRNNNSAKILEQHLSRWSSKPKILSNIKETENVKGSCILVNREDYLEHIILISDLEKLSGKKQKNTIILWGLDITSKKIHLLNFSEFSKFPEENLKMDLEEIEKFLEFEIYLKNKMRKGKVLLSGDLEKSIRFFVEDIDEEDKKGGGFLFSYSGSYNISKLEELINESLQKIGKKCSVLIKQFASNEFRAIYYPEK